MSGPARKTPAWPGTSGKPCRAASPIDPRPDPDIDASATLIAIIGACIVLTVILCLCGVIS